jgi:hypothetical protein
VLAVLQRRGVLIGLFVAATLAAVFYASNGVEVAIRTNPPDVLGFLGSPLVEAIGWIVFASSVLIGARRVRPLGPRDEHSSGVNDVRYAKAIGIGLAIVAFGNLINSPNLGTVFLYDGPLVVIATGYAVIAVTLLAAAAKLRDAGPDPTRLRALLVTGAVGVALGIIPDLLLLSRHPFRAPPTVSPLVVEGLRAASFGAIGVALLVASSRMKRTRPDSRLIGTGLVVIAIGIAMLGVADEQYSRKIAVIGIFIVAAGDGVLALTALRAANRSAPRVDWHVGERLPEQVEPEPLWATHGLPN